MHPRSLLFVIPTMNLPLLQLMRVPGIGHAALNRLLNRISDLAMHLDDLTDCSRDDLVSQLGLRDDWADIFLSNREDAERLNDELERRNVRIVLRDGEMYPKRLQDVLGSAAPPVLFVRGNAQLLQKQLVAVVGMRDCSERGKKAARSCVKQFVKRDISIVSGNAAGIDETAHRAALENGGCTIFVLPYGILNAFVRSSMIECIQEDNHLFLSEFSPDLPWATHAAMQRNRTVCALSEAVLLVESGAAGGSFATGKNAQKLGTPLFVLSYDSPNPHAKGNAFFLQRGARKISEKCLSTASIHRMLGRPPNNRFCDTLPLFQKE